MSPAHSAFHVSPEALHSHANNLTQRADTVQGLGQQAGGVTMPSSALGALASGTGAALTGHYQQIGGHINNLASRMAQSGSDLHDTANRYQAADEEAAQSFRRLTGEELLRGNRPRPAGGGQPDSNGNVTGELDGPARTPVRFAPGSVTSTRMNYANGELAAISFTADDTVDYTRDWAAAPKGHNRVIDGRQQGTPQNPVLITDPGQERRFGMAPGQWLMVDGHAFPNGFMVEQNGQDVLVNGDVHAHIVAATGPFQEYARQRRGSLYLLMSTCSVASPDGDAVQSFMSTLSTITNRPVNTLAGTGEVSIDGDRWDGAELSSRGQWIGQRVTPDGTITPRWPTEADAQQAGSSR